MVDPVERRMMPLLYSDEALAPAKATNIIVERCDPQFARRMIAAWHSRLPRTQIGPWKLAFAAHYQHTCFGAALWHNPSARMLPNDWLELRRLAVAPDAPHCTASRMLGQMARWIAANMPEVPNLISYRTPMCTLERSTARQDGTRPTFQKRGSAIDRKHG